MIDSVFSFGSKIQDAAISSPRSKAPRSLRSHPGKSKFVVVHDDEKVLLVILLGRLRSWSLSEGSIVALLLPHAQHHHRQLTSSGNHRLAFGCPAASGRQFQAMTAQIAVRTIVAQQVLGALH